MTGDTERELNNGSVVQEALRTVVDPELGINIADLGLIYDVAASGGGIAVTMTLTSPTCPLQAYFVDKITAALRSVFPDVTASITFTFTPRWSLERATPAVKQELALRGIPLTRW